MYKDSKWAKEIINLQKGDGSWGYFHSLSEPDKYPMTTEYALRRLQTLGYTMEDIPIQRAVEYISDCLAGIKQIPDRREKTHDWDIFTSLIFATWIRRFTNDNSMANKIADMWAKLIAAAFFDGTYNHSEYVGMYCNIFGVKPKGNRLVDFVSFYQVSIISDQFEEKMENAVLDYILNHNEGIYYTYGASLSRLPVEFASKQASRYLGAIELLSAYKRSFGKLNFVSDWLMNCQNENGKWDMGNTVKDKVYFPLSDSWRRKEEREADCTYRIQKLLHAISPVL